MTYQENSQALHLWATDSGASDSVADRIVSADTDAYLWHVATLQMLPAQREAIERMAQALYAGGYVAPTA